MPSLLSSLKKAAKYPCAIELSPNRLFGVPGIGDSDLPPPIAVLNPNLALTPVPSSGSGNVSGVPGAIGDSISSNRILPLVCEPESREETEVVTVFRGLLAQGA